MAVSFWLSSVGGTDGLLALPGKQWKRGVEHNVAAKSYREARVARTLKNECLLTSKSSNSFSASLVTLKGTLTSSLWIPTTIAFGCNAVKISQVFGIVFLMFLFQGFWHISKCFVEVNLRLTGFITSCFLHAWEQKCLHLERDSEALQSMKELVTDGNRSKMISITSGMF